MKALSPCNLCPAAVVPAAVLVAVEEEARALDRALPTCPVAQEGLRVLEAALALAATLVPVAQAVIPEVRVPQAQEATPEAPALQVVEDGLAQGKRLALVATRVAAEVIREEELAGPVPEASLALELDVLVQGATLAQEVLAQVQAAILAQEVLAPEQAAILELEATALAQVLSLALVASP